MVKLTREEKKMYQVFSLLMGYAIGANITTMKQISIYVAKSTRGLDVMQDCSVSISDEKNAYQLMLSDGRKILFSRNSNEFGFIMTKEHNNISSLVIVSERIPGDLSTISVYSETIIKDNGMSVLSFRPNNISDNSLKFAYINHYTDDEIDWVYEIDGNNINYNFDMVAKNNLIYPSLEEKYFVVSSKSSTSFDCFNGMLEDVLLMIDLLNHNLSMAFNMNVNKKKLELK